MKKLFVQICLAVGLFIGSMISAQAQSTAEYRGHIAFDFNVGDRVFSSGDYIIGLANPSSNDQTIRIRNAENGKADVVLVIPRRNDEQSNISKLIFNYYGSRYFLCEINTPTLAAKFRQSRNLLTKNSKPGREEIALLKRN